MKKIYTIRETFNLADESYKKGELDFSINLYKAVVQVDPKNFGAHNNLIQKLREYIII